MRLLAAIALGTACALAQTGLSELIDLKGLQADAVDYKGRKAMRLSELPGGASDGGLGILKLNVGR